MKSNYGNYVIYYNESKLKKEEIKENEKNEIAKNFKCSVRGLCSK